eukprot:TRINITY_DN21323_c0_g2_i6.p1 TRINITY_DN21323_c0_g2~~TRINITY_DN21323_c0_g2_i6.p1  ORF type:complete len:589 (+),score=100.35 TRINITY_DN21323_c0_g2_i6:89-1855(+)
MMDSRMKTVSGLWRNSKMSEQVKRLRTNIGMSTSTVPSRFSVDMKDWSPWRQRVGSIVYSLPFELLICCAVIFNTILLCMEVDASTTCDKESCTPAWVELMSKLLLVVYTTEVILQMYLSRSGYFKNPWNYLDFGIVAIGFFELLLVAVAEPDGSYKVMGYSRMLRMTRMLRFIQILKPVPELYRLVSGFFSTLRTIFWGFLLLVAGLFPWSMITVEIVNSVGHVDWGGAEECSEAFSSVLRTWLLYWQILIANDEWGTCTVPLMKQYPGTFIIFATSLVTVQLGFTNLILAVIVDAAADAREKDIQEKNAQRKREEVEDVKQLGDVLARVDKDGSGTISVEEFYQGFDEEPGLQHRLLAMGLDREDLIDLMLLIDADKSGELSYEEIISAFLKAEQQDARVQFLRMQLQMDSLSTQVQELSASTASSLRKVLVATGVPETELRRESQYGTSSNKSQTNREGDCGERLVSEATSAGPAFKSTAGDQRLPEERGLFSTSVSASCRSVEDELGSLRLKLEGSMQLLLSEAANNATALALRVAEEVLQDMKTDRPESNQGGNVLEATLKPLLENSHPHPSVKPNRLQWQAL